MRNKILSLLLIILSIFSFAGCNRGKKDQPVPEQQKPVDNKYNNDESNWTDSHWFEAKDTSNYMVIDGKTEYKIVAPSSKSTAIQYAVDEFVTLFKEATGLTLSVDRSDALEHTVSGKYISIGETSMYKSSGLNVDIDSLGKDGVRILTKDNTVYILGGDDYGVLYGVYDFLKINFGFETFYKDCYVIDKGVKNLKHKNYNVTDLPDVPMKQRMGILYSSTQNYDDVMYSYRLRMVDDRAKYFFPIHEEKNQTSKWDVNHNSLYFLPMAQYKVEGTDNYYPEFYSTAGEQLCYTARGDKEKYEKMVELCADKVIWTLQTYTPDKNPLMNIIHIGAQDNWAKCECNACKEFAKAHNDSDAAAVLKFVNDMGKIVVEWMNKPENEQYKRDNLQFSFFVYQWTLKPPFTVNDDGTINIAEDLKAYEGVTIKPFTAFSTLNPSVKVDDEQNNASIKEAEMWCKYAPNAWSWTYGGFFQDYFCFYDVYTFYSDYFKFLYKNNFQYSYAQFHSNQRGADSGFFTFANYVISKLSWDSSLNLTQLIDDYFDAMYGEASDTMKVIFNACRDWFNTTRGEYNWTWSANQLKPTDRTDLISLGFVNSLFTYFEQAYSDIEVYKEDKAVYDRIKSHIDIEWLFPAKVAIGLYSNKMDTRDIKQKFKQICGSLGVTRIGEFPDQTIGSFTDGF